MPAPTDSSPADARPRMGLSTMADGRDVPNVRRRLVPEAPDCPGATGWLIALAITAMAAVLRFVHLGRSREFLFDETYYAKDAWSLLQYGYVRDYIDPSDTVNAQILDGNLDGIFKDTPSMIVHPEVGKWLIAIGEHFWGFDPTGWRIASAVAGSLMVLVMIRLVRRLTGSTLLGCIAGILLCFDGLHFVMSRLALLDIFLALFLLMAVACLVADRGWGRRRVARMLDAGEVDGMHGWKPPRGLRWRPWRLLAGVMFGLAIGTKWTAAWPLAVFGLWVVFSDAGVRRMIGVRRAWLKSAVSEGITAFGYLVVVAFGVYLVTWTGWLMHAHEYDIHLSDSGYGDYWGDWTKNDPSGFVESLFQGLRSLWHYHLAVLDFHSNGLVDATHPYQSNPIGWPLLNRSVGVQADVDIQPGDQGCSAAAGSSCLRLIVLLGTPALWWAGAVAMVYAAYLWLVRKDWRYGVAVLGFVSTWLPWLPFADRPIFLFYAVAMVPFTIIGLTLILGRILGPAQAAYARRAWGAAVVGAFVVVVIANFAWFYPVYTAELLTRSEWLDRIWFTRWI